MCGLEGVGVAFNRTVTLNARLIKTTIFTPGWTSQPNEAEVSLHASQYEICRRSEADCLR